MYVIAKELIGAPGMPATTKGIRQALQRYVQGKSCCSRRRSGSKATEYSIDCLPEVTQQALRERYALQLMTQKADESPAPVVTKARRSPAVVDTVEAYRGSPQLMLERLNALTENQRQVADARIAIVSEVLKVAQQPGFSCAKAHGRPFAPEVTFVIDGGTRFVVGWSLDLAENVFAVAGAIQHGIRHHGKPFLYYSDNGSGETADVLDKEIVGILPRLGINHPTGIAGNPQGRGIIERLNRTLPMRIARKYRTYFGKGADRETLRKTNRDLRSAFSALQQGKRLNARQQSAMRDLPSWSELIDAIRDGVEWYNNRPHDELPMKPNGKHYSPAEFRKKRLAEEDTEIEWLSDVELRDMFRPMVERPVRRCEIRWLNNIYYAPELRDEHGRKVLISYDIHDAERITVRRPDGSVICEAVWDGNKREAFPVSAEYYKQQQRLKGMRKRAEEKIRDAEDEVVNVLEHKPQEPWLENIYRPVGNTVTVQQPVADDEPDEEYERNFQRGLQLLEAKLKESDPLA